MNNEEAIERLEDEKKCVVGTCGQKCKYWACNECFKVEWQDAQREAIDMAISALEKQNPKKPKIEDCFTCPNCEYGIVYGDKYCQECGQLIDWDLEGEEA